ncbi:MAG: hypothetical protein VYA51_12010 [Planctomycetota bacterium]|nr:hypothetical protein [Planctomycetota bacterium]
MNPLLSTIFTLCVQSPAVAPQLPQHARDGSSAPLRLDVVRLKNGDQLVGRITADLDAYVEIQIEDGATIGVSRAQVQDVLRAAKEAPARAAVVRPDDGWFLLHDADGRSVGWLHASVTTAQDGSFAVNEEYEFVNGVRRYQVTNRCAAGPDGRGRSCYFRERVSKPRMRRQMFLGDPVARDDRVEDERIVEAVVDGAHITITRLDDRGRHERTLPWSEQATFPLLARTLVRQSPSSIGPTTMFDPRHEELQVRRVDGDGARQLMVDGVRQRVAEISVTASDGVSVGSREWVGPDLRVIRRELAGPSLVAVPSSAESARAAVGAGSIASAVVAEADGRFGIWVPSPAWRCRDSLPPGHLALDCDVHDADVRLSLLEHLEPGTTVEAAADAVGNWFSLLHPHLQLTGRFGARVRGRSVVRMQASDARNLEQATVDVIPFGEDFLVLICRASRAACEELESDFAFVRRTLELERAGLSPAPTGPLQEAREGHASPALGPLPPPTPAPRIGHSTPSSSRRAS